MPCVLPTRPGQAAWYSFIMILSHSDADIDRIVALCHTWIKEQGLTLECFGAVEGPGFVV